MKSVCFSNICIWFFAIIFFPAFLSCSTSPKDTGDVYILRPQAEEGLESANKEAAKGNFEIALSLLTGYKRNAIITDDISLIVRVCLSRGNVLFSLGRIDEAFQEWDYALGEALLTGDQELLSVSRIFYARGNLLSGKAPVQSVLDEVNRESVNVKKNRLYIAFSWQVKGLALSELERWNEAETAMKQSLAIHDKDKRLENAAYDWYIIASIRSLAGNTAGALQALDMSIAIDRRIENSWGLASSWRAKGDVFRKIGREQDALNAYLRSREIYSAIGNIAEAAEVDRRINK